MLLVIFFVICFGASIVGAICGIGGGVIIKPVLDAFQILDVATISFLSGCTVLSMSTYAVLKSTVNGKSQLEPKTGLPLALGAAAGGILGKWMFGFISALSSDKNKIGAIQAICLLIITAATLLYTLCRNKLNSYHITNAAVCVFIGIVLGILSSFLGLGGGPVNLAVLYFFFSMNTKAAAENSLYIIFYSQITSLLSAILTGSIPKFSVPMLLMMVLGGILGGIMGRSLNSRISNRAVDRLFTALLILIICINIYNYYIFTN